MNHFEDDIILKFVLETLDDDKTAVIKKHLMECEICSAKFNKTKKQIEVISSYNSEVEDVYYPLPKRNNTFNVWLKRAAVLIIGFIGGYITSVLSQPDQITVVEQHLITKTPAVSVIHFNSCPNVDIWQ
jgi:hypothetical protein